MNATSGRGLPVPFAFFDPASRSLKTSATTFDSDSTPSSPTLPPSGSMRSGALYARRMSALPTSAAGFSSSPGMPTPRAWDWKGPGYPDDLPSTAALLPTPRTSDTNGPGLHGDGGMDLRTTVTLLPTPTASFPATTANFRPDGTPYREGYGSTLLDAARHLLPTPLASDGGLGRGSSAGFGLRNESRAINRAATGASTPPPSPAGNTPPDDEPPGQLTLGID